jgi:S-adenosylmethionine hydrolase
MQIITLTTDYGYQDFYVAQLKGAILSKVKNVTIVDVSHSLERYDIVQTALFLESTFPHFPENSIHIVSVLNYYGRYNDFLITKRNHQIFITPNNGVLSLLFPEINDEEIFSIDFQSENLSELFAHCVAAIEHGLTIKDLGPICPNFIRKMGIQPVITNSQIRGTIIHIDHYENVVINIKKNDFDHLCNGRSFQIYYKQNDPICELSRTYNDVDVGESLCLFNSSGYLEIAVNMGKAATMYNLNKDETIQINFAE